jgi:hypothetical protein
MAVSIIYEGQEYPIDENGNVSINGKLYNAQEAVAEGKAEFANYEPSSSSSSSSLYGTDASHGYSSYVREPAPDTPSSSSGFVKSAVFPVTSIVDDIAHITPEGKVKKTLQFLGDNVAPPADLLLNYGLITGKGIVPKTGAASIALGIKGLPTVTRKIGEFATNIPKLNQTLKQFTKGAVSGEKVAAKSVNASLISQETRLAKLAELENRTMKNAAEMSKIRSKQKLGKATDADHALWQQLNKENGTIGTEIKSLKKELGIIENKIIDDFFVKRSNAVSYDPFIPEAAEFLGGAVQRGALYQSGKAGLGFGAEKLDSLYSDILRNIRNQEPEPFEKPIQDTLARLGKDVGK